jgi:hypothetical protein
MDQSQIRRSSYDSPSQFTKNPIQNIDGPPIPRKNRPHNTTRQPSTSKNLHSPPPEGKRNNILHNISSSSDEMLENQSEYYNGWQQIRKTKRKRLQAPVHTVTPSQTETSNRYEMLAEDSPLPENRGSTQPTQVTKPPPIFLHGVVNFTEMMKSLTEVVEEEQFYTKSLANNVIKIVSLTLIPIEK